MDTKQAEAAIEKAVQRTTLRELGPNLPVGGTTSKDMVARPWRMKEEKEIGALREKMKKDGAGAFVAAVVAALYTKLGDVDLAAMLVDGPNYDRRVASICKLPMGDVMYAYTWLRYNALGPDLALKIGCPSCRGESQVVADLGDLDVKLGTPGETWTVELKDPVVIREAQAKKLTLGIAPWDVMRRVTANANNPGLVKAEIIRTSVLRVDDRDPFALAPADLDELSKRDIEALSSSLDDHNPGPDFAIDTDCVKCGAPVRTSMDWGYDSFFSTSSGRKRA